MEMQTAIQLQCYNGKGSYNDTEYGNGVAIGKGATWNNLDSGGRDASGATYADIMLPNFFPKNELSRFVKEGQVMRGHGKQGDSRAYGFEKAIGIPIDAVDNGKGLQFAFTYHGTPDAQNERMKIEERLLLGKSAPLSIWYGVKKFEKFSGKSAIEGAINKYVAPEYRNDAMARMNQYSYIRVLHEGKLIGVDTVYEGMDQYAGVIESKETGGAQTVVASKIAPRETAWNPTAATRRVKVATQATDEMNAAYGKCFLYCEEGKQESFEGYKLPIYDVVNGETVIVPKAVFAAAWFLNGKQSADIPDAARETLKTQVSTLYKQLASEFSDASILPPWEKKSSSAPMFSAKSAFEMYEAKGTFEDTLKEKITNVYFLFDVWQSARCDVRNMAYVNEQAGVPFDTAAAMKEVNQEFLARLNAADDEEFSEVTADSDDEGMSASNSADGKAVNADSIANQAHGVEYLATRLEARANRLIELRGKEARTLSDASLNPIEAAGNAMMEHGSKLLSLTKAERDKRAAKKKAQQGKGADPVAEPIIETQQTTDENAERLKQLKEIAAMNPFLH